jgi:tRNA (guanine-N7-)-methyltransferase
MALPLSSGRFDTSIVGVEAAKLPPLAATPEQSRLDFRAWWAEERRGLPFELEIGSGKGTFLKQQASQLPGVNFLGIEYAGQFWRYAADRLRRNGLHNVRLLYGDAVEFVTWRVADAMFQQAHIYFPDPWPKKRHHKRRSITDAFLLQLHRVLLPGGVLRIVTDHDDYWAWINEHVGHVAEKWEPMAFEKPLSAGEGEVVGTNFERKYRREGRPFHAMALRKR